MTRSYSDKEKGAFLNGQIAVQRNMDFKGLGRAQHPEEARVPMCEGS